MLVDHGTASSAEIVTAALQQHGRANVVGTHTYGKGVYQEIIDLPGGAALDMTVGEFFTPNGTNLGAPGVAQGHTLARGRGVTPDVYAYTPPTARVDTALLVAERVVALKAEVSRRQPPGGAHGGHRRASRSHIGRRPAPAMAVPRRRASRCCSGAGSSSSPSRSSDPDRGSRSAATPATTSGISSSVSPPRRRPRPRRGTAPAAARGLQRRLGRPDVARDVIEALMVDRGLTRSFDAAVERAASAAAESVSHVIRAPGRRDLRAAADVHDRSGQRP